MPEKSIELVDFARRVEYLCETYFSRYPTMSWEKFYQFYTLKEDAADLQFPLNVSIKDLDKYVKEGPKK